MKIGIDLGGTNIRVGAVSNGKIVRKAQVPTPRTTNPDEVVDAIVDLIRQVAESDVIEGIGIGVPSVVDWEKGIVYNVMNIPSWKEVHIKDILESEFGVPVAVNNDANCFALGEKMYGAARLYDDVVGITLGTGVGAGLIFDGRLYSGRNTAAGEVCSLPYLDSDYEHYCSSGFFVTKGTSGRDAALLASAGNAEIQPVWQEFGGHVANLVKAVLLAYDPQAIVFGGSIAKAFKHFEKPMMQSLQSFMYPNMVQRLKIFVSELDDVAIYGASALVQ
ncbi:MAG: ROK family protein [Muribaculaceae bacterium]